LLVNPGSNVRLPTRSPMQLRFDPIEETLPREKAGGPRRASRGEPVLFLAFFCDNPLELPSRHDLGEIDTVTLGRGRARRSERDVAARSLRIELPDPWTSAEHARLRRSFGGFELEDLHSRNGVRINGRLVEAARLEDGDLIEVGHTLIYYRREAGAELDPAIPDWMPDEHSRSTPGFVTLSAALARELSKAWELASADLPLLIQGESGTGKEVLARALAERSDRRGPFVGVNCGAIPPSLVESELFGHVKGAFTGADSSHDGLIRSAHKGTLFLDEIGDLELGAQAALLRVLQEREVRPVGATRSVSVDVRLLSATHRDLDALVEQATFRADLLSRLAGFRLRLPPLRQRREDIGLLVAQFVEAHAGAVAGELRFEPDAARRLFRYHWPLNIRELDNCLRAAAVLARGAPISDEHLSEQLRAASLEPSPAEPPAELGEADAERREELVRLLRAQKGNVSAVARQLGKARTQVQRWLKRYRLDPRDYQG
jgi:DNA-binding NtrC family response regulator